MAIPPQPPKGPPRFVPTLTEVVRIDQATGPDAAPPAAHAPPAAPPASWDAASGLAAPAVPVPAPWQQPAAAAFAPPPGAAPQPASASALPAGIEEYIVHRVMQRVDVVLDQRLREAIATVVQEQTRSMVPRLREEVESVVRHAVYEAVAEELSTDAAAPR